MEDECDICGRLSTRINKYKIEGAEVLACQNCGKHGTIIESPRNSNQMSRKNNKAPFRPIQKSGSQPSRQSPQKYNNYRKKDQVLNEDYYKIIQQAREGVGLSREDFAKKLFIRETFLMKIETMKQRPSDELAKKIEKSLNISLFIDSSSDDLVSTQYKNEQPVKNAALSLGDFMRIKKKK